MTDFVMKFDNEQAAIAALPWLYDQAWNTSVCIPNIDVRDQNANQEKGWFIRIAGLNVLDLPEFDQTGWICQPVFAEEKI